jgi:flagellar motor switch protein FliN
MADDSLISQADIDNLLASLSLDEPADTPALTLDGWLNAWFASTPLAPGITLSVTGTDCIESWDNWTYAETPATLLVQQYGSTDQQQTLLMLPTLGLQQLAIQTLAEDPATAALPITEPQMTSLGNALKAWVKQVNDQLASQYGSVTGKLTPFEITEYDQDFLTDIAPWLASGNFYELAWTISGLPTGDITLYQLWQKEEADRLLALANQSASQAAKPAVEPKAHATPPQTVTTAQASATLAEPVTVQPVQFSSFDHHTPLTGEANKNLDLVLDITLNLSVELGKTQLSIKEVLELTRGSVIELDRIAGEPVDLYANGKLIAKGEVVVIEDNFGLRITSIASPADRLKGLA